eukprot:1162132-Pelagomonas_calceolata.AAC.9
MAFKSSFFQGFHHGRGEKVGGVLSRGTTSPPPDTSCPHNERPLDQQPPQLYSYGMNTVDSTSGYYTPNPFLKASEQTTATKVITEAHSLARVNNPDRPKGLVVSPALTRPCVLSGVPGTHISQGISVGGWMRCND